MNTTDILLKSMPLGDWIDSKADQPWKGTVKFDLPKTDDQDSLRVMDAIKENLVRERQLAPRGVNLEIVPEGVRFDAHISDRKTGGAVTYGDLVLPMLGEHNVQNALAAVAIASEMGLSRDVVRRAMAGFEGVRRRFTRVGEADGIAVIDDYGHHPVEIAAVLKTARQATSGRVIAVVQPHRFTRLRELFEEFCTCFNDADAVVVAHVYAAGEDPIEGIDRDALIRGLEHHGHRTVLALDNSEDLAEVVGGVAEPGDMVVCLGAGDITGWANALPDQLGRWRAKGREAANDDG